MPQYTYFCDEHVADRKTPITNQEVVALLCQYQPKPYYAPNTHFDYSNTGYCLLAAIVEKVSGKSFEDFLRANIFQPLGRNNTVVCNKAKIQSFPTRPSAIPLEGGVTDDTYLNGVVGDKGVYSTVEDLFKWDMALYSEKLVKKRQPWKKPYSGP